MAILTAIPVRVPVLWKTAHISDSRTSLSYSLPQSVVEKMKMQGLKVYFSGQNLLTFTRYTGVDPEVGADGIDNNLYPLTRTFTFGIDITF
jgi:hypothetical protein